MNQVSGKTKVAAIAYAERNDVGMTTEQRYIVMHPELIAAVLGALRNRRHNGATARREEGFQEPRSSTNRSNGSIRWRYTTSLPLNAMIHTHTHAYPAAIFGPAATTWFAFLQRRIVLPGKYTTIGARVALDQLLFTPTNLFCFLSSMAIMEGTSPSAKLKSTYATALKKNWQIWPGVQFVNFAYVPLEYRVFLVNIVSLGWNCYLSYLNGQQAVPVKEKEDVGFAGA